MEGLNIYFEAQKDIFEGHFSVIEEFQDEAVHKTRVSLKRIRAYLSLIEFIESLHIKKNTLFAEYQILFKKLADIRDFQVQFNIIEKYELQLKMNFKEYNAFFEEEIENRKMVFLSWFQYFKEPDWKLQVDFIQQINSKYTNPEIINIAKKTAVIRLSKIEAINCKKEKNLHKIRILIKDTHYIFDIINSISVNEIDEQSGIYLKKIEDHLGNWHDKVIAKELLENFMNTKNDDSFAIYNHLTKKISIDIDRLQMLSEKYIDNMGKNGLYTAMFY